MKTKVLGVTDECPSCKTTVTCGNGYNDKLQWQYNGKAHYNFANGKVSCNPVDATEQSTSSQSGTTKTLWSSINGKTPDMQNLQDGLGTMIALAYESTKIDHPDLDDQGDKFGTIVNARTGHLIRLALIKSIKDWEKHAKL